jgi:Methyltransferase domain
MMQQQQQSTFSSSSRSRSRRISTEKLFVFILVVSVNCFQLALHYSSMDTIQSLYHDYDDHGDGDDRYSNNNNNNNKIHHDDDDDDDDEKNRVMESSSSTRTTTTTTNRPGSTTTRNNHHHHHHPLRLANKDVCINIRSQKTAPASMQPKIDIETGQGFIARGGYERIAKGSGPIHAATGLYVNLLSHIQHVDLHLFGTVAELGVHHGRFTSVLFITARVTEKLVVVDLFDELQNFNVDLSGRGNYKDFVHGLRLYGLQAELDLYRIYKTSTDQLPFNWVDRDGLEPFRLVSLDAGHTAALTLNDLQLVFCNLLKGGVVIIDDWYVLRFLFYVFLLCGRVCVCVCVYICV